MPDNDVIELTDEEVSQLNEDTMPVIEIQTNVTDQAPSSGEGRRWYRPNNFYTLPMPGYPVKFKMSQSAANSLKTRYHSEDLKAILSKIYKLHDNVVEVELT